MGFLDNIASSIGRSISSAVGGAIRDKTKVNKWTLIDPNKEFKKVAYENLGSTWTIHYDHRPVGDFNVGDIKAIKAKTKAMAYDYIAKKLEMMHWVFKNRKLNDMVTTEFMNKLGFWSGGKIEK